MGERCVRVQVMCVGERCVWVKDGHVCRGGRKWGHHASQHAETLEGGRDRKKFMKEVKASASHTPSPLLQ